MDLWSLSVEFLDELDRSKVVFQVVGHVVDSQQLDRHQPVDKRVRLSIRFLIKFITSY